MRVGIRALLLLVCAVASCGNVVDDLSGDASSGQGEFYVHAYVPAKGSAVGASYERKVTFKQPTCTTSQVGPCSVNPCALATATPGAVAPDAGAVTITGAEMTPVTLEPGQGGAYPEDTAAGVLAWGAGGSPVTFQWEALPGTSSGGGSVVLSTPPYIALAAGSPFAGATASLSRSQDLTLAWTSDTPATPDDQVAVDLDSGTLQLVCIFAVTAGTGTVPQAALAHLAAGAGTFNVHSKTAHTLDGVAGTGWNLGFNVDADARTSYGLASGSVTFGE